LKSKWLFFADSIANAKRCRLMCKRGYSCCWQRQPYPFGDSLKHFFAAL